MTELSIQSRFQELVGSAQGRLALARGDKPIVAVQAGHCGVSVGASELAQAAARDFEDAATIITAGCDGACFAGPAALVTSRSGQVRRLESLSPDNLETVAAAIEDGATSIPPATASDFLNSQRRVALEGCGSLDAESIYDYLAHGGYSALAKALQSDPADVIQEVKDSRVRGRGGAYFPAGLKWESARGFPASQRYVIVNCEEGEPGLFKDRHLMEGVPHRIIEGACIAAYASDAREIIFYINAEANLSAQRMERAIRQAGELGLIGENALGSGFDFNIEIRRGAGGYVCGEETTLINTVEGYRREPRIRPPYPVEAGLWSRPTVINNAETLANVPYIINNGAEEFAQIGDGTDSGTKIINLSGAVRYPGLIEVPIGTTLREIIYDIGGGPPGDSSVNAIGVGGPSSGILPASMLDTPIKPGFLHESGVMLGAGAVIVMDDSMSPLSVVRNLAQYNANESCGKCTPCREGTPRMVEILDSIAEGKATQDDVDELSKLARLVNDTSLCGLGQAAGNPILSGLRFFGDEMMGKAAKDGDE